MRQIEESVKQAQFDLWTGKDDKIMRRLEIEFSFDLPEELRTQAQGVAGGTVDIKVEIADLNEDQEIKVPEDGAAAVRAAEPARRRGARPR